MGPKSQTVEILSELLKAGMSVARFNFSHGSHDYHQARMHCQAEGTTCLWCTVTVALPSTLNRTYLQATLDTLRKAMQETQIMCAVMLDTKVRCHLAQCMLPPA